MFIILLCMHHYLLAIPYVINTSSVHVPKCKHEFISIIIKSNTNNNIFCQVVFFIVKPTMIQYINYKSISAHFMIVITNEFEKKRQILITCFTSYYMVTEQRIITNKKCVNIFVEDLLNKQNQKTRRSQVHIKLVKTSSL